jgi:hypothetical protein
MQELYGYDKKTSELFAKVGILGEFTYPREWEQISSAEWEKPAYGEGVAGARVVYTAPSGMDLYRLLNIPVRERTRQIWAANVIKRALRSQGKKTPRPS